jgi:hypothetical protein
MSAVSFSSMRPWLIYPLQFARSSSNIGNADVGYRKCLRRAGNFRRPLTSAAPRVSFRPPAMTSSYEEEPNPFSQDVGFDGVSGLSTPSVEHITFTPEGTTVESSQSTVNGQFLEGSRILVPPNIPGSSPPSRPIGYKSEIDRYLHSGEDVEILVATHSFI